MAGGRVRSVRGLVVVVFVVRLFALFILAVVVMGLVVMVVMVGTRLFFVFDYGYYDGVLEGHVRLWCGCGGWGSLRRNGILRVTGLRMLDCCGLSMLRSLLVLWSHDRRGSLRMTLGCFDLRILWGLLLLQGHDCLRRCGVSRMLDDGWLGVLGHGVRPFSSVRVLGRSGSHSRGSSGWSSVRVFNGLVDNRVDFACCWLGCRVVGWILLVVGSGWLVGIVGVVGGFDGLDGVVRHVVWLVCGLDIWMICD